MNGTLVAVTSPNLFRRLTFSTCHFRWKSYPMVDVMGISSRVEQARYDPQVDTVASPATIVVMCPSSKKELYAKFKSESIPIESRIDQSLADHINAEVTLKTITSKQDAVDWLTWTFYYRRLSKVSRCFWVFRTLCIKCLLFFKHRTQITTVFKA